MTEQYIRSSHENLMKSLNELIRVMFEALRRPLRYQEYLFGRFWANLESER